MEVDSSSSDFWVMVAALKVCETNIASITTGYSALRIKLLSHKCISSRVSQTDSFFIVNPL